jgi:hypothetical protein
MSRCPANTPSAGGGAASRRKGGPHRASERRDFGGRVARASDSPLQWIAGIGVSDPYSERRSDRAARSPHNPWTPPPGGVDDEHNHTFGMGVRYGSTDQSGRNRT